MTISRCGLITRKEGMPQEEFQNYWLNVHGPIAANMKNLRKYEQHVVVDNQHRHPLGAGPIVIDGYSELQFDSYGEMVEGVASLNGAGAEDISLFASPRCPILVFAKKVDTELPQYLRNKKLIKRVSFLGRKPGVTAEQFKREWWYIHSMMVKAMPGYVGYTQNLVIDRIINGKSVSYEELPVEGMVEFWFEDMDAFNECYNSSEFKRTSMHGAEFIGKINTYLMETYPVELPTA